MEECWSQSPTSRPAMRSVYKRLENFRIAVGGHKDVVNLPSGKAVAPYSALNRQDVLAESRNHAGYDRKQDNASNASSGSDASSNSSDESIASTALGYAGHVDADPHIDAKEGNTTPTHSVDYALLSALHGHAAASSSHFLQTQAAVDITKRTHTNAPAENFGDSLDPAPALEKARSDSSLYHTPVVQFHEVKDSHFDESNGSFRDVRAELLDTQYTASDADPPSLLVSEVHLESCKRSNENQFQNRNYVPTDNLPAFGTPYAELTSVAIATAGPSPE